MGNPNSRLTFSAKVCAAACVPELLTTTPLKIGPGFFIWSDTVLLGLMETS